MVGSKVHQVTPTCGLNWPTSGQCRGEPAPLCEIGRRQCFWTDGRRSIAGRRLGEWGWGRGSIRGKVRCPAGSSNAPRWPTSKLGRFVAEKQLRFEPLLAQGRDQHEIHRGRQGTKLPGLWLRIMLVKVSKKRVVRKMEQTRSIVGHAVSRAGDVVV